MKRRLLPAVLCALCAAAIFCSCTLSSCFDCTAIGAALCPALDHTRMDNFAALREDYGSIARFAQDCLEESGKDQLTIYYDTDTFFIHASDDYPYGRLELDCSDDILAAAQRIDELAYRPFSYIEVNSDHLIFWKDETGDYGVLYSDRPWDIITARRDSIWRSFRFNRLDGQWYEIGQMR